MLMLPLQLLSHQIFLCIHSLRTLLTSVHIM